MGRGCLEGMRVGMWGFIGMIGLLGRLSLKEKFKMSRTRGVVNLVQ